jgi:hypothetical protein
MLIFKIMKSFLIVLVCFVVMGCRSAAHAQSSKGPAASVRSVKLFKAGDQTSFPAISLNSNETLQLVFDDMDTRIKNFFYTFQLCNADWSPSILSPFEYIRGFQNSRITTYRNSAMATVQYVHYQATIPERSSAPTKAGNYLLKVFLDNDTSKLAFTRRFVVVNNQSNIQVQVQQPFNARFFRSFQKLMITVQTEKNVQLLSPNDLKVVVLQNNNWQTSMYMDRPTIFRGNFFEYSDEALTAMPAAREFRWIDLRSLRLMSDRMKELNTRTDTTQVYVRPDQPRNGQAYIFYRDLNGSYTLENMENLNPFWQSDYANVHFTYIPPGNKPLNRSDVHLFGEMTDWAADASSKMVFNEETGAYEKTMLLKQGFYNYNYITRPSNGKGYPDFSQTEGDFWLTENSYTILVYVRPFGGRADELIGISTVNTAFQNVR